MNFLPILPRNWREDNCRVFSIILLYLPNSGRIPPALIEESKIEIASNWDRTQDLLINTRMFCWLCHWGKCRAWDFCSDLCFMHHFTCWTLFISRINRTWLYKGHGDSGWQLNVNSAHSVGHWHDDQEVLGSILIRGNFLFCFSLSMLAGFCQDLPENEL